MILHASELASPSQPVYFLYHILVSTKEWIKLLIVLIDSDAGLDGSTKEGLLSRQHPLQQATLSSVLFQHYWNSSYLDNNYHLWGVHYLPGNLSNAFQGPCHLVLTTIQEVGTIICIL